MRRLDGMRWRMSGGEAELASTVGDERAEVDALVEVEEALLDLVERDAVLVLLAERWRLVAPRCARLHDLHMVAVLDARAHVVAHLPYAQVRVVDHDGRAGALRCLFGCCCCCCDTKKFSLVFVYNHLQVLNESTKKCRLTARFALLVSVGELGRVEAVHAVGAHEVRVGAHDHTVEFDLAVVWCVLLCGANQ